MASTPPSTSDADMQMGLLSSGPGFGDRPIVFRRPPSPPIASVPTTGLGRNISKSVTPSTFGSSSVCWKLLVLFQAMALVVLGVIVARGSSGTTEAGDTSISLAPNNIFLAATDVDLASQYANVTIDGGNVEMQASSVGIQASNVDFASEHANVTIDGGNVEMQASSVGIHAIATELTSSVVNLFSQPVEEFSPEESFQKSGGATNLFNSGGDPPIVIRSSKGVLSAVSTPQLLTLTSDPADAGRQVRLIGFNATYSLVSEVVTLTGGGTVSSTTAWWNVNRLRTEGTTAITVDVTSSLNGSDGPTLVASVQGSLTSVIFVPPTWCMELTQVLATLGDATGSGNAEVKLIFMRKSIGSAVEIGELRLTATQEQGLSHTLDPPIRMSGGDTGRHYYWTGGYVNKIGINLDVVAGYKRVACSEVGLA